MSFIEEIKKDYEDKIITELSTGNNLFPDELILIEKLEYTSADDDSWSEPDEYSGYIYEERSTGKYFYFYGTTDSWNNTYYFFSKAKRVSKWEITY